MTDALVVRNLNKSYATGFFGRKKAVLEDVNFSVPQASITGFVGVNGSGKTTTIKCLLRFIFPDTRPSSAIEFFGRADFPIETQKRIAYLPERPYLPEHLSAAEFLSLHWKLGHGKKDPLAFRQACESVLTRVNLPGVEKTRLRGFSKGMLQRIGLAQALLHSPDFLILDEPMSGLDPDGRRLVKNIILEEHKRGATIFFSSHLLADMDELCTHLVVIDQRKVHFSGPVENFTHVESVNSVITYIQNNERLQLFIEKAKVQDKISEILGNKGQIIRVVPVETSIENVFTQRKWLDEKSMETKS